MYKVSVNGKDFLVSDAERCGEVVSFSIEGLRYTTTITYEHEGKVSKTSSAINSLESAKELRAPLPGVVASIPVTVGATVNKGDILLSLEAMKMENALRSPGTKTIQTIHVTVGESVAKGALLITFA